MQIQWLSKEQFWKLVASCQEVQKGQDAEFYFQMPLYDIRARIRSVPPEFTPIDEADFPGPVERWYGVADGHRFVLTYHYCSPVSHSVVVQHGPGASAAVSVKVSIEEWKSRSPY